MLIFILCVLIALLSFGSGFALGMKYKDKIHKEIDRMQEDVR